MDAATTQKAIEVLVEIAESETTDDDTRVRAACAILDHAHTEKPIPAPV